MGEINLWKRANLERPTPETRQLIDNYEQLEYEAILEEKLSAGVALNSLLGLIPAAQERVSRATQAQQAFFHNQPTGGAI